MNEKNNEIILFETHDQEVKLSVSLENELDKENNTQKMRVDGCKRIAASIFWNF